MNLRLRLSKVGLALAVTFLLVAAATFALHVHEAPAGSAARGEREFWFFLCTLPWAFLIPEALLDAQWWPQAWHLIGWLLVAWNAFLIYCLGGGLVIARRGQVPRSSLSSR